MAHHPEGSNLSTPPGGWTSIFAKLDAEYPNWNITDAGFVANPPEDDPQPPRVFESIELTDSPAPMLEAASLDATFDLGLGDDLDTWVAESTDFLNAGQSLLEADNSPLTKSDEDCHMANYVDLAECGDNVDPVSGMEEFAFALDTNSSVVDACPFQGQEQTLELSPIDVSDVDFDWNKVDDDFDLSATQALTAELGLEPLSEVDQAFADLAQAVDFNPNLDANMDLSPLTPSTPFAPQQQQQQQQQPSFVDLTEEETPGFERGSLIPQRLFSQPRPSIQGMFSPAPPSPMQPRPLNLSRPRNIVAGNTPPSHFGRVMGVPGPVPVSVAQPQLPLFQPVRMMPLPNAGQFTFRYPAPNMQLRFPSNGQSYTATATHSPLLTGAERKREWRKNANHRHHENQRSRARARDRRQAKRNARTPSSPSTGSSTSRDSSSPVSASSSSSSDLSRSTGVSGSVRARHSTAMFPVNANSNSNSPESETWYRMTQGGHVVGYIQGHPSQVPPVLIEPYPVHNPKRVRFSSPTSPASSSASSTSPRRSERLQRRASRRG